jgi:predicted TIM-barrel fold metal-dependent hydrolase
MCSEYVRAFNDLLLDEWAVVDPRFRLAAAVSPHDPEAAAEEIRRIGGRDEVTAVALPLIDVNLGHRHYHAIYEAALEHGLPVVVHPSRAEGVALGAPTLGGGVQKTPAERLALLPQVAAANLASIVFDGVLERHRELVVMFSGFGFEWIPAALWRFAKEWQALRIDVPWVERSPGEQVGAQIRVAVSGRAPRARHDEVATLAEMIPPGVLTYGSNRPESLEAPDATIASYFSPATAEAVGHRNGVRVIGAAPKDAQG